ncbi:7-carboxy-7-deazaguanine synthase QueE [Paenibacillus sp. KN14-4R]|uniref:7-carboxy-7-deazaguanine synthase QueE n=1 Tax=Paenibacillus sp. KN14-4R TaxID=3445773 RepID=UPI003F9EC7C7
MRSIPVLEIFGPTVQGEGMAIGQKTMFVRTAGCDYRCSWCDSAFTWDGSAKDDIRMMRAEEIWEELYQLGGDNFAYVTFSGGNPLLLPQAAALIDLLKAKGIRIGVETQGTMWQDWLTNIDDITLSPKPPSSGMTTDWAKLDAIIAKVKDQNVSLKVVVFDDTDFEYAKEVHGRYPGIPFYVQVGNDDTKAVDDKQVALHLIARYETLIERALHAPEMNQVRVLPQLHALVWGNKKGV